MSMADEINLDPCFCREEDYCPPRGAIDLFRCGGLPLIGTLPHFYLVEELLDNVESGLSPEKDKHEVFVLIEIVSSYDNL